MDVTELSGETFVYRRYLGQDGVELRLSGEIGCLEDPGASPHVIGLGPRCDGNMFETGTETRLAAGSAQRNGRGRQSTFSRPHGNGRAILRLDRIDTGVEEGGNGDDVSGEQRYQIMRMDGVADDGTTQLPLPTPPPFLGIIISTPLPVGLKRKHIGLAEHAPFLQRMSCTVSRAIAILKDGKDLLAGSLHGVGDQSHIGQGAGNRLFADGMLASIERGDGHVCMEMGRQANVNEIDGRISENCCHVRYGSGAGSKLGPLLRLVGVQVADIGDFKEVRQAGIARNM